MRRFALVPATITLASAVLLADRPAGSAGDIASALRTAGAQTTGTVRPAAPREQREAAVTPDQLKAAIDQLGKVDYAVRTTAARTVRRTPAQTAVPALLEAIAGHADGYVRFRSLVLLSGFNDSRTREAMATVLAAPNDRLRAAGFTWFELNPDPQMLPRLLDALAKEESEFVRPAVTRAVAAQGGDPRVQQVMTGLVMKGQDFFRSGVIEALGDYKGGYALQPLTQVAKLEGPLQADAVLAIGKIGDKRALETLAALQRTAPRNVQPSIAAAICLLGINCASHQGYLAQSLTFSIPNIGY
ncbi:MAG: HEAT repeat domain-containing protein, partial [Acidobacteriota bacterium]